MKMKGWQGREKPDPMTRALWSYSAVGGSLSVAVSGVISLLIPNPWAAPSWIAMAVVLCTGVGWFADKFLFE